MVKNPSANAGEAGLIPGWRGYPGVGNDNPFQYSCLGNPKDRGAWRATVHGVKGVEHDTVTKQQQSYDPAISLPGIDPEEMKSAFQTNIWNVSPTCQWL